MVDGVRVEGMAQLAKNLAEFGSAKVIGRIITRALSIGARIPKQAGATNARALGLGFMGYKRDADGRVSPRYGRIPRSLKAGKPYIPRADPNAYRVNVVARGQSRPGLYRNKAPHAHFIEYGFTTRAGRREGGRPFLGPALSRTAPRVTEEIRRTIELYVDRLRFPE